MATDRRGHSLRAVRSHSGVATYCICACGATYAPGETCPDQVRAVAELEIRRRHRDVQDGVVGGYAGIVRCICGERRTDPDDDCAAFEREIEVLRASAGTIRAPGASR